MGAKKSDDALASGEQVSSLDHDRGDSDQTAAPEAPPAAVAPARDAGRSGILDGLRWLGWPPDVVVPRKS
jgi:hypothetical protein